MTKKQPTKGMYFFRVHDIYYLILIIVVLVFIETRFKSSLNYQK